MVLSFEVVLCFAIYGEARKLKLSYLLVDLLSSCFSDDRLLPDLLQDSFYFTKEDCSDDLFDLKEF
jgi:hypothetical protein